MRGYDAPETTTNICCGEREKQLGQMAVDRVVQLLNGGNFSIHRTGQDRYGRTLAEVYIKSASGLFR